MRSSFPQNTRHFLGRYLRRRLGSFTGLLALVVTGAACSVAAQYGMKLLVDAITGENRDIQAVAVPLGLFIGLIAIESASWRLAGWLACRTVVATGVDIRLDLVEHLVGHSMGYFADQFGGTLGSRITATTGAVGALISAFALSIIPPLTDFLGALIVLATIDWRMPLVLSLFVAISSLALAWFGQRGRPVHLAYSTRAAQLVGEVVDTMTNMWAVKAFSARSLERARLARLLDGEAALQRRSWMQLEVMRVLHDLLLFVLATVMLSWTIRLWTLNRITPGDVVVASALTFRILHGSRDMTFSLLGTVQHFVYIAGTLRLIGQAHWVDDPPGAPPLIRHGGAIQFDKVSYAYRGGRLLFENFNLTISAGQWVGVVGPSGAGKSTLVSLVQRLDDVTKGRILIDGQCLADVTQDTLRDAIGVVPQDISLFHRSIMENIRYGRPEATDEEVFAAARAARCEEFIGNLPNGYATMVGERGMMLSGGQRQRVGIARALLKNAPIILLDEATSALDRESELDIQNALTNLMVGRTVLAVAHRLSTLVTFDRIIVLVNGCIEEDGSPAELRRRGGLFDKFWRLQAEGRAWD
jgi:ATP-binding cassette, subfamily B, bacterial